MKAQVPKDALFLKPWDKNLIVEERKELLDYADRQQAEKYISLTLIKEIQASPCKLQIMECWEKKAFRDLRNAEEKLRKCREIWVDCNEEKEGVVWYVDLGEGNLTWTTYNLILQFCREQTSIVVCADPGNMRNKKWSGWTEVFLDKFCPRKDWIERRANFILHLEADMQAADQHNQWFKFLLRHHGG